MPLYTILVKKISLRFPHVDALISGRNAAFKFDLRSTLLRHKNTFRVKT
jgi:hypothetical protein